MKNTQTTKSCICILFFLTLSCLSLFAGSISHQPGNDIVCSGRHFTYKHDVREHGIDPNLSISGDPGFVDEIGNPYASYYTDNTRLGNTAVYQYTFVAEPGKILGDVSISSRAYVYFDAGTIVGEYQVGEGGWTEFLSLTSSGDIRPIDIIENVHNTSLKVRYTLNWNYGNYRDLVQLFRSWGPEPGKPGDFAFTFKASLVSNADCHKADICGEDLFVDFLDFAALSFDYGKSETNLTGDINQDGVCDLADLQLLASYWLCDCYD